MKVFKNKKALLSALGLFIVVSTAQAIERIVATVNGIPILESQVKTKSATDYKTSVDRVIDNILVQQAIQESKVKIDYTKVDQMIENIAAQNGLTYGQFLDALDYQGLSLNDYRNQLINQFVMSEIRNQAIGQSIEVSREDVEALGKKMLQEAKKNGTNKKILATEYKVRHILLKLNPLLNDAQAESKLSQIRSDIISGKITFGDAALKYSKDYLSGANGGELGFAFPETYTPNFAKTIMNLKKGIISQPIKTEFGWHILEVVDTRQGDRTKEAYMQKAYEQLVNQQAELYSKDWVKALRKRANIKYLN